MRNFKMIKQVFLRNLFLFTTAKLFVPSCSRYKDGVLIMKNSTSYKTFGYSLAVIDVQQKHAGVYTVSLSNKLKGLHRNLSYTLVVNGKLLPFTCSSLLSWGNEAVPLLCCFAPLQVSVQFTSRQVAAVVWEEFGGLLFPEHGLMSHRQLLLIIGALLKGGGGLGTMCKGSKLCCAYPDSSRSRAPASAPSSLAFICILATCICRAAHTV